MTFQFNCLRCDKPIKVEYKSEIAKRKYCRTCKYIVLAETLKTTPITITCQYAKCSKKFESHLRKRKYCQLPCYWADKANHKNALWEKQFKEYTHVHIK